MKYKIFDLLLNMSQKKIFVFDDSKDILEGMKMFLELKEYEVRTKDNVNNIMQEITDFEPDLIILDIYLKGEDGRQLCKKIKQSYKSNPPKIILFSAAAHALEDYHLFGADDCLEKPFGLTDVYTKIETLLPQ